MGVKRFVVAAGVVGEAANYRWTFRTVEDARGAIHKAFGLEEYEQTYLALHRIVFLSLTYHGVEYAMISEVVPDYNSHEYRRWEREDKKAEDEDND